MSKENLVKFNLRNVHYAPLNLDDPVNPKWDKSKIRPLMGGVGLTADPQGNTTKFYADGIVYFQATANNGYEGDLELALLPDYFRTDCLGEVLDANGVMLESSADKAKPFALLYEVEGDEHNRRAMFYYCTASRTAHGGKTKEESITPETDKVTISMLPLPGSYLIRANTTAETKPEVYENWYTDVYYNPVIASSAELKSLAIGSLTLIPEFNPNIAVYTATTNNATNAITVEHAEDVTATITVNGTKIANGAAATWKEGANMVVIVTESGSSQRAYTVQVTKE